MTGTDISVKGKSRAARRSAGVGRRCNHPDVVYAIDHVVIVVSDLDAAAELLYERHGLASVAGGRHAGQGTGNRIVPLGESYLELMAVVDGDEAAGSPLGSWVERRLGAFGDAPAALCLRTDDIDALARRTGHPSLPMRRIRPDGATLDWHLVAIEAAMTESLPFFIQWHVDPADHPSRMSVAHRGDPSGIESVDFGGDEQRLASWLGSYELPLRLVEDRPGPVRVAIAVADGGTIVIG